MNFWPSPSAGGDSGFHPSVVFGLPFFSESPILHFDNITWLFIFMTLQWSHYSLLIFSAMSLLSIHDPNMYKSSSTAPSSSSSVSPISSDHQTASVRIDLSR